MSATRDTLDAEQVTNGNGLQILVALGIESHAGNDADAHAQFDIGLDHVRIDRFQQDVRLQLAIANAWSILSRPVKALS